MTEFYTIHSTNEAVKPLCDRDPNRMIMCAAAVIERFRTGGFALAESSMRCRWSK